MLGDDHGPHGWHLLCGLFLELVDAVNDFLHLGVVHIRVISGVHSGLRAAMCQQNSGGCLNVLHRDLFCYGIHIENQYV